MDNGGTQFVFDPIAGRYDCCNHLFSLGLDRRWRRAMVRGLGASAEARILDICCGTGDVVFDFLRYSSARRIVGVDLSESMLHHAQEKQIRFGHKKWMANSEIAWRPADAASLPYEADSFDIVTCAFGIRNVTEMQATLREAFRVLKPSGRIGFLEFSAPSNPLLRTFYLLYLRTLMPAAGRLLLRKKDPLNYLAGSIVKWHTEVDFAQELKDTGFTRIEPRLLTCGIVTLWLAKKPT